jgi:hypothetical protein
MTNPHLPTAAALEARVLDALRYFHSDNSTAGLLDDLLIFRRALADQGGHARAANNQLLRSGLTTLRRRHSAAADLLELRYLDQWPVDRVAIRLNFAASTIHRRQHSGVQLLAAVLLQMESAARSARQTLLEERIGATSTLPLVGVDEQVALLAGAVQHARPPWLLSIDGMGGIGKTALAAALLRQMEGALDFDGFAWVSAQPAILDAVGTIRARERPALTQTALVTALLEQLAPQEAVGLLGQPEAALGLLRTVLKRSPHLVVIDNLETMVDLETLLPVLRTLVEPSKIVITSRKRLVGETDIHLYAVPELSERHALALVRQAGSQHNVAGLLDASDADLRPIYATVGGNPLALLLLVGQLHLRDLDTVLADLQGARGKPVENLYTFIYWRAWEHLDARARQVLLAMSLVKVGGDHLDFIAATSDLSAAEAGDALQQLLVLNLVYGLGDVHARRYAIHSLTRSFLHEQVARWVK